ncbi:sodium/potassium/calcium exchanger 6-like protein, partial [Cricetulus griseus]
YLGLYVFYVVTVILCTWVYQRQRSMSLVHSMPETPEILSDSEEDQVSSNTNSYDYDGIYEIGGLLPVWAVVVIVGTALASVTFFATSNREPPRLHWLFAFLGFLTSALWINAAATEVVNILRSLGVVFRLSNTVLGLTLLAWGNSIGDAFSDFTLARQGYPRMAFSACFGGIIFSILCELL